MTEKTNTKIKDIAIRFCNEFDEQFPDVTFNQQKLDNLIDTYSLIRDALRKKMKNPTALLDRHKIAALYSISIMTHEPLTTVGNNPSPIARNSNAILALKVGQAILASFQNEHNPKLSREYMSEFVKLIMMNRLIFQDVVSSGGKEKIEVIFFLSHIYYFIERIAEHQPSYYISKFLKRLK
jgi:hypothetical protein